MADRLSRAISAYQAACAHDRAGEEAAALPHYERALALGLPSEQRRGALLGLGSTLRNLGRTEQSVAVLQGAVKEYPDDAALGAFLALALWSSGQPSAAIVVLLELVVRHAPVGEYRRALTEYTEEIRRRSDSD